MLKPRKRPMRIGQQAHTKYELVYFIKSGRYVKIGYTANLRKRLTQLRASSPLEVEVIGIVEGLPSDERRIQDLFGKEHHKGDWFILSKRIRGFIRTNCRLPVPNIDRGTAIHLSAHAIASVHYGFGFHEIHALSGRTRHDNKRHLRLCSGERVQAIGVCVPAMRFQEDRWLGHISHLDTVNFPRREDKPHCFGAMIESALRNIVVAMAGSAARARVQSGGMVVAMLRAGMLNWTRCEELAAFISADEDEKKRVLESAEKEARRFVRDSLFWDAINELADIHQLRGSLDGYNDPDVQRIIERIPRLEWGQGFLDDCALHYRSHLAENQSRFDGGELKAAH